jgi:ribosomal protein L29
MDDTSNPAPAPAGWLEALARSEAQLAAGQLVPGEEIMRELRESIARLEAKQAVKSERGAVPGR